MQFSSTGGGNSDLTWLNQLGPERGGNSAPSTPPGDPHRNRRLGIIIAVSIALVVCIGIFAVALYQARVILYPPVNSTAPATGQQPTCQELIDRAMQSSGNSCDQMGSNQVCYGNNTLTAELNSAGEFAQEGDVVSVADLRRLAASPLDLASEEWGIAVFKVLANLPRSLPGETITMVVFGNTTLDNPSSNLQSFYFSSTLGQIQCDQVPFDGLMISMPDGAGVRFIINGADMTLMGDASLSATANGQMEVSLYSGSAIISANGGTQLVLAGETTSMELGGPNGNSAVGPPSSPVPLSPEELALACTLTGDFCSPEEITPVSPGDMLGTLQVQLGIITPNPATSTPVQSPSALPSLSPTPSLSVTTSQTASLTRTTTSTPTRSRTPTITTTRTRTATPTRTPTGTRTQTPSITATFSGSLTATSTLTGTRTPTSTTTGTLTVTSTRTYTPTASITNTGTPTRTPTITDTPLTPAASDTPLPPTATDTPLPPTATDTPTNTPNLVTLCHCTAADTCIELTVPDGSGGHWTHPLDIIPAPGGGCPVSSPTPTP